MNDEELQQLLPWYINGTLDPEEQAAVEALLERSPEAQQELTFLRGLAQQVAADSVEAPSELGWHRLQREIKQAPPVQAPRRDWWKPGLAAAASVIVVLQAGLLFQAAEPIDQRLLNQGTQQLAAGDWQLQLQFAPDSDWQRIAALLDEYGARLVDGPSGVGLVRIAVSAGQSDYASAAALRDALAADPAVIHVAVEAP